MAGGIGFKYVRTAWGYALGGMFLLPIYGWSQTAVSYQGYCDASAAAALDKDHFVVANDERNVLQVYKRGQIKPVELVDLWKFLSTAKDKESDIEAATTVGTRIFWISSHGRNSKGARQDRRLRFFATEIVPGSPPTVKPVGQPYGELLDHLLQEESLKRFDFETAAGKAPEDKGGLNIEGLAVAAGGELLIGFRNPVPEGRALVVTLRNPEAVIQGQRPQFGPVHVLDLGGRGIRSMERVGAEYLIVAGPFADDGDFALYQWSGKPGEQPAAVRNADLKDLRPEALFAVGGGWVQVISDDGKLKIGAGDCRDQETRMQTFRSLLIKYDRQPL